MPFGCGTNGGALIVANGRGDCAKLKASDRSFARTSVDASDPLVIPNVSSAKARHAAELVLDVRDVALAAGTHLGIRRNDHERNAERQLVAVELLRRNVVVLVPDLSHVIRIAVEFEYGLCPTALTTAATHGNPRCCDFRSGRYDTSRPASPTTRLPGDFARCR